MRRTFLRLAFPTLAIAGAVAACSADSNSAFLNSTPKDGESAKPTSDTSSFGGSDAAAAAPERAVPASPLCGFTEDAQCFPDDIKSSSCSDVDVDVDTDAGGGGESDASTKAVGCRLGKAKDAGAHDAQKDLYAAYAPACVTADRAGTDGVACSEGADCAPGYDCVTGEKGSVCRRYCCSGSCEDFAAQNGGPTFCDVQSLVDHGDHQARVCMPLKPCKLFVDGDCSSGETCAVVNESGTTGCVAKGSAKVDQPCDEEHCEGGLTCLGSPGNRRCYKLCRIDGAECTAAETCTPGSLFHDMKTGVCKTY